MRKRSQLAELSASLHRHSHRYRRQRRIASLGSLALGLGLLLVPKPEEPPLWLTCLFVLTVLAFAISLGWICRSLNEGSGFSVGVAAPVFEAFQAAVSQAAATEAVPALLDTWLALSQAQRDALLPSLAEQLVRLDATGAAALTSAQTAVLIEIIESHPHTDIAILGLLTLSSARHGREQLLPLAQDWAQHQDRRGTAAQEYLLSLEAKR